MHGQQNIKKKNIGFASTNSTTKSQFHISVSNTVVNSQYMEPKTYDSQ